MPFRLGELFCGPAESPGVRLMQILVTPNLELSISGQTIMMPALVKHIGIIFVRMHRRRFIMKIYVNLIWASWHQLMPWRSASHAMITVWSENRKAWTVYMAHYIRMV